MRFIRGAVQTGRERTRKATAASVCLRCVCARAFGGCFRNTWVNSGNVSLLFNERLPLHYRLRVNIFARISNAECRSNTPGKIIYFVYGNLF